MAGKIFARFSGLSATIFSETISGRFGETEDARENRSDPVEKIVDSNVDSGRSRRIAERDNGCGTICASESDKSRAGRRR